MSCFTVLAMSRLISTTALDGSARRTRRLDQPDCVVERPEAANEKQRYSTMASTCPAWRPSLFCFLRWAPHRRMVGSSHGNITPVPAGVTDAMDHELAEEWLLLLVDFC